jgi:WD40 repeat protein
MRGLYGHLGVNTVRLLGPALEEIQEFHCNSWPTRARLDSAARLLAIGEESGIVTLYEASTGRFINQFAEHTQSVSSLDFDPDGRMLFTTSSDGTVRAFDIDTGKRTRLEFGWSGVTWLSDEARCLSNGHRFRIWDPQGVGAATELEIGGNIAALSPNGTRCLASDSDGYPILIERASWTILSRMLGGSSGRYRDSTWTFTPDGRNLIIDGTFFDADLTHTKPRKKYAVDTHLGPGHFFFVSETRTVVYPPGLSPSLFDSLSPSY